MESLKAPEPNSKFWKSDVPIKDALLTCLPFPLLQARTVTAIILAYYGYKHETLSMLQTLNHKSRAYIVNADGLQGFLKSLDIIAELVHAQRDGTFDSIT